MANIRNNFYIWIPFEKWQSHQRFLSFLVGSIRNELATTQCAFHFALATAPHLDGMYWSVLELKDVLF